MYTYTIADIDLFIAQTLKGVLNSCGHFRGVVRSATALVVNVIVPRQ